MKGSAVSCSAAGDIVDAGRGVPEDLARAVRLYTKGCDGGDAPGCWRLSSLRAFVAPSGNGGWYLVFEPLLRAGHDRGAWGQALALLHLRAR